MIALGPALRFHGGGHLNHSIFWQNLAPGGGEPDAALIKAAEGSFGSFENMKASLSAATVAIQGSGWGWLGYNKQSKNLSIITCPNQDPLEPTTGNPPLHKKKRGIPINSNENTFRPGPASRHRRLGARLLPAVQECASRLRQKHLQHRQLG